MHLHTLQDIAENSNDYPLEGETDDEQRLASKRGRK
jgi:hypothetical protein